MGIESRLGKWRTARPVYQNHLDDSVDSDQHVVKNKTFLFKAGAAGGEPDGAARVDGQKWQHQQQPRLTREPGQVTVNSPTNPSTYHYDEE